MILRLDAPVFEDDAAVADAAALAGLGGEFTRVLRETARAAAERPGLLDTLRRARRVLFDTDDDPADAMRRLDSAAGPLADRTHELLVLDVVRLLLQRQGRRGVPEDVTHAVIDCQPGLWLRAVERELIGTTGSHAGGGDVDREPEPEWDPEWFRLVARGDLYRLGRLEFAPMKWRHPFRWFRNRHTGERVLVADDGLPLTADGYLTGDLTWTTRHREDGDAIEAHAVHPSGHVQRRPVRLPQADWEPVLSRGDRVLDLHVPSDGGRLTPALVRDSLEQAGPFFDRWYPDRPFVAFFCGSWLFGPQLPGILGHSSGIVAWQREGYLLPDAGPSSGVLRWVFGTREVEPATAPRDTRLRAGLLDLVAAGETLRQGGWLFARDDLPRFGTQPYGQGLPRREP